MSQLILRSGGSSSGAPRKVTVTKTPTNLHLIIRQETGDITYTFDFGSQGHLRIMQFFNHIGANKFINDHPDLSFIFLTALFTDLDRALNQGVLFHTINPKYFQDDVLEEDMAVMRQPSFPAVRSLPSFARSTSATIAVKQEPGSNKKKRKSVGLDLGVKTGHSDVTIVPDPMAGILHFGGRDQGKIRTAREVIKKTSYKALANIVLHRNHALAYKPMANIAGCFFDVEDTFDFNADSKRK